MIDLKLILILGLVGLLAWLYGASSFVIAALIFFAFISWSTILFFVGRQENSALKRLLKDSGSYFVNDNASAPTIRAPVFYGERRQLMRITILSDGVHFFCVGFCCVLIRWNDIHFIRVLDSGRAEIDLTKSKIAINIPWSSEFSDFIEKNGLFARIL